MSLFAVVCKFYLHIIDFYIFVSLELQTQTPYCFCGCCSGVAYRYSFHSFIHLFIPFLLVPLSQQIYARFSSAETSAIDLKLHQNVQHGLNSRSNIFLRNLADGQKIKPYEISSQNLV